MKQQISRRALYLFLLIIFAAATVATSSVIAYFTRNSGEVTNDFSPADSVKPEVVEKVFDGSVKENVSVNVGDTGYPVYVRAAIVITWQKSDGTVYFSKPKDTDYTLNLNLSADGWAKGSNDEFYYYKPQVKSGGDTDYLINSCVQIGDAPVDGYTLSVKIIVQTVQAIGTTDDTDTDAYKDAWGLS